MNRKSYSSNRNLHLIHSDQWNGFPILSQYRLAEEYLIKIKQVFDDSFQSHSRVMVMRFDLRYPSHSAGIEDEKMIGRFIASLKAKIKSHVERVSKQRSRRYTCVLRYVWVREQNYAGHPHYHVAIFVNKDFYFRAGCYKPLPNDNDTGYPENNLAQRICAAWRSALGIDDVKGLVHFAKNAVFHIRPDDYQDCFKRLSYFAKVESKHYGDHSRHFGASHRRVDLMDCDI